MPIDQFRRYVFLFDASHKYYKNVVKKVEIWNKTSEELGTTSKYSYSKIK